MMKHRNNITIIYAKNKGIMITIFPIAIVPERLIVSSKTKDGNIKRKIFTVIPKMNLATVG